jgi:hypothetical protein
MAKSSTVAISCCGCTVMADAIVIIALVASLERKLDNLREQQRKQPRTGSDHVITSMLIDRRSTLLQDIGNSDRSGKSQGRNEREAMAHLHTKVRFVLGSYPISARFVWSTLLTFVDTSTDQEGQFALVFSARIRADIVQGDDLWS